MFRLRRNDKCRGFRKVLSAYIDNRLDGARRARLEEHLAQCQDCRTELESLRQTVGLLRQVPVVQPSHAFTIRQPEPAKRPVLGLALRVATGVVAVLLALVFALDMSHVFQSASPAKPPVAATTPAPVEKSAGLAAAPDTQPAPTASPVPQPTATAPGLSGPPGVAGQAGPLPTSEPSPTPQPQSTASKGPIVAGVTTPTPTPTPTPEPTPTPSPTPAPTATPVAMAAVPSPSAEDREAKTIQQPAATPVSGSGTEGATSSKTTSRMPFRPLEWALLATALALGAATIITSRIRQRETRGGRK